MSFSSEVKAMLSGLAIKKNCCKKALLFGLLSSHSDFSLRSPAFYTDNEKVSALTSWVFRQVYGILPYYDTSGSMPNTATYYRMKKLSPETEEKILEDLQSFCQSPENDLICPNCSAHFMRGLFLAGGTVSDPTKKGYHLEILLKDDIVIAITPQEA